MDLSTAEGFRAELERLESESRHRRSAIDNIIAIKKCQIREHQAAEADLHRLTRQRNAADAHVAMTSWEIEQLFGADATAAAKATSLQLAAALISQERERAEFRRRLRGILTSLFLPS
jgi:hypothetical protein